MGEQGSRLLGRLTHLKRMNSPILLVGVVSCSGSFHMVFSGLLVLLFLLGADGGNAMHICDAVMVAMFYKNLFNTMCLGRHD